MYTIGEAAARSGVSIPTLRAWERRYGVVHPVRTAGGYRLYDDEAIARLSAMRSLIAAGWRPGQAAARTLEMPPESTSAAPHDGPSLETGEDLAAAFVRAATAMDLPTLESILDEAFGRTTFERAAASVVSPAMRQVGQEWEAGRLDVAAEHAASHALLRRFSALYDASAQPPGAPRLLVGLPPGARHEAGALAFAIGARRAGIPTLYLGADLPVASWLAAQRRTRAAAVVVAVPTAADRAAAAGVAGEIAAAGLKTAIFLGGPAADGMTVETVGELLPEAIPDAVRRVRLALA